MTPSEWAKLPPFPDPEPAPLAAPTSLLSVVSPAPSTDPATSPTLADIGKQALAAAMTPGVGVLVLMILQYAEGWTTVKGGQWLPVAYAIHLLAGLATQYYRGPEGAKS